MRKSLNASVRSGRSFSTISRRKAQLAAAMAAVPALAATQAFAQTTTLFWDINNTNVGSTDSTTGVATGTWDATTANWSTLGAGTVATVAYTAGSAVIFAATGASLTATQSATGTSTVTVAGTQNLLSLTVQPTAAILTFASGTAGQLLFSGGSLVLSAASTTIPAAMMGTTDPAAFSFNKTGAGLLSLTGAATYANNWTISAGVVQVNNANGLGTGVKTPLIGSSGTLAITGGINFALPLAFSNTASGAAVQSVTGTNTFSGGMSLSFAGGINTVSVTAGTLFISGAITDATSSNVTKAGTGSLNLTATNTYHGITAINSGVVTVSGAAGTISNSAAITLGAGSALVIDNTTSNTTTNNNRLSDTAAISITSANLAMVGNGTTSVTENVGALTVNPGTAVDIVTMNTAATQTTKLGFTGLTQVPGSLTLFRGGSLGQAAGSAVTQITFGTAPSTFGGGGTGPGSAAVMSGAIGDLSAAGTGTDFVTYDATNGIRPLQAADYLTTVTEGQTTPTVVALTAPVTFSTSGSVTNITAAKLSAVNGGFSLATGSTLNIASGGIITNTNAQTITGGTVALGAEGTFFANSNLTINSSITGASGFVKGGAGTLTLGGSNSGLSGLDYVLGGNVNINSSNALGTGTLQVANPAVVTIAPGLNIANSFITNGSTLPLLLGIQDLENNPAISTGGAIALTASGLPTTLSGNLTFSGVGANGGATGGNLITVAAGDVLTLSGSINDTAGAFAKAGPGTLILSGANSVTNFNPVFRLYEGTLLAGSSLAFGGTQALGVLSISGAKATVGFTSTAANPAGFNYATGTTVTIITSTGTGAGANGVNIDNPAGNNTYNGVISLANGGTKINVLNVGNAANPTATLNLIGANSLSGAAQPLIKTGPGSLVLGNTMANWNGNVTVSAGTLSLKSVLTPATKNARTVTVLPGALLQFDDVTTFNATKLAGFTGTSSTVNLQDPINLQGGGELRVLANAASTTATGATLYSSSMWTLSETNGTAAKPQTLAAVSVAGSRPTGGYTLFIRSDSLANNVITMDGFKTNTGGIVPWAVGANSLTSEPTDFVSVDATTGAFKTLTAAQYTNASAATDPTGTNYNVDVSGSLTGATVNSLKIANPGTTLDLGAGTSTVTSGAVLAAAGTGSGVSTIQNGTLAFGAAEGIVTSTTGHSLTISAGITGTNGLTISGRGTTTLSGNNTGLTGGAGLTLNGGELAVANDTNLGATNLPVVLNGGFVAPTASFATSNRPTTLSGVNGNSQIVAGVPNVGSTSGFDVPSGVKLTWNGTITGSGQFFKKGAGTVVLTADNSATLGDVWNFSAGTVEVNDDKQLGNAANTNGTFIFNGGTLQFDTNGSADMTGRGFRMDAPGGGTVNVSDPNGVVAVDSFFGGNGSFTKTGAGTFRFTNSSPGYAGGTTINGGTLEVDSAAALPVSAAVWNTQLIVNHGRLNMVTSGGTQSTGVDLVLNDGATFAGFVNWTAGGAGYPQIGNGANVLFTTLNGGDVLDLTTAVLNNAPGTTVTPTIKVTGQSITSIDIAPATGFVANWIVDNTTLRSGANFSFGASAQANPITFTSNGGTLDVRSAAATIRSLFNPIITNGSQVSIFADSTVAAGGTAFATSFGPLTINAPTTLYLQPQNSVSNIITNPQASSNVFQSATLNADLNVNAALSSAVTIGTVTGNGHAINATAGTGSITVKPDIGDVTITTTDSAVASGALTLITTVGNYTSNLTLNSVASAVAGRAGFQANANTTWNGAVNLGGGGIFQITSNGAATNFVINSSLDGNDFGATGEILIRGSGTGVFNQPINAPGTALSKTDAGTWTLAVAGSDFGDTVNASPTVTPLLNVVNGTLKIGVDNAIPTFLPMNFGQAGGAAVFDLGGFNQTLAALAINSAATTGSYKITNSSATPSVLTLNSDSPDYAFNVVGTSTPLITGNLAIVKQGLANFSVAGASTYTGGTTIQAGTITQLAAGALGAGSVTIDNQSTLAGGAAQTATQAVVIAAGGGTISAGAFNFTHSVGVTGPGTLTTTSTTGKVAVANFRTGGLSVAAGTLQIVQNGLAAGVSTLPGAPLIATGSGAQLDLTDNDLVIGYTSASPMPAIQALLAAGYNGGNWNTPGINSSVAAADSTHVKTLGYADAADVGITSVDGFTLSTVAAKTVVVKFTYEGDSSLDGKVDLGNDFNLFLIGYLSGASTWELGDYNYDSHVDSTDFGMFVDGYIAQGATSLGALENAVEFAPGLTIAQRQSLLAVIPEPSSLSLVGLAAAGLASRRRRRNG